MYSPRRDIAAGWRRAADVPAPASERTARSGAAPCSMHALSPCDERARTGRFPRRSAVGSERVAVGKRSRADACDSWPRRGLPAAIEQLRRRVDSPCAVSYVSRAGCHRAAAHVASGRAARGRSVQARVTLFPSRRETCSWPDRTVGVQLFRGGLLIFRRSRRGQDFSVRENRGVHLGARLRHEGRIATAAARPDVSRVWSWRSLDSHRRRSSRVLVSLDGLSGSKRRCVPRVPA